MNKYKLVFKDLSVREIEASGYSINNGRLEFYKLPRTNTNAYFLVIASNTWLSIELIFEPIAYETPVRQPKGSLGLGLDRTDV